MSFVSSLGTLTGAQSSSGTSAAKRAASAGAAFNLTLQNLTEKANADALAARAAAPAQSQSASSSQSSVHDAPKADDAGKSDETKDTQASSASSSSGFSASASANKSGKADSGARCVEGCFFLLLRCRRWQARRDCRQAGGCGRAGESASRCRDRCGDCRRQHARRFRDRGCHVQAALAQLNAAVASAAAQQAGGAHAAAGANSANGADSANGEGAQSGVLGKGARGAGLLNVAANDGKSGATVAAATTTQTDAAALTNAQAALEPSGDAATAAQAGSGCSGACGRSAGGIGEFVGIQRAGFDRRGDQCRHRAARRVVRLGRCVQPESRVSF